jgi:hypothetical protein
MVIAQLRRNAGFRQFCEAKTDKTIFFWREKYKNHTKMNLKPLILPG